MLNRSYSPLIASLGLAAAAHAGLLTWLGGDSAGSLRVAPVAPVRVQLVSAVAPQAARRATAVPAALAPLRVESAAAAPLRQSGPAARKQSPGAARIASVAAASQTTVAQAPSRPRRAAPVTGVAQTARAAPAPGRPLPRSPTGAAGALVAPSLAGMHNPPPVYPRLARRRGHEGLVLLQVGVDSDGRVNKLVIRQSSGFERLDRAAREGVAGWRFQPGRRGNVPVQASLDVPVRFRLTDG